MIVKNSYQLYFKKFKFLILCVIIMKNIVMDENGLSH
jgi:hypothetical protein